MELASISINILRSKVFLTGILVLFSLFACNKKPIQQEEDDFYQWTTEDVPWTHVPPLYYDESYFILSAEPTERIAVLNRVDEKYGEVIYAIDLGELYHLPNQHGSKMWENNGQIFLIVDRLLYVIEPETGEIIRQHVYQNYLWRSNVEEDCIYTCFYSALDEFNYAKIDIGTGAMTLLHTEKLDNGDDFIAGHAPVETPHGPVFPLSRGNKGQGVFENSIIWPKPGKDSLIQLDWTENSLGGPVFDDESTIYLFMMKQMLAYRKSDMSLKWKMESDDVAAGSYVQTDQKIYLIPSPEIGLMFIIDKRDGSFKTLESPACLGNMERIGDHFYFVGWGDFKKFNMVTEEFAQWDFPPFVNSGYQPFLGVSTNSKMLWNNGWHCFPTIKW